MRGLNDRLKEDFVVQMTALRATTPRNPSSDLLRRPPSPAAEKVTAWRTAELFQHRDRRVVGRAQFGHLDDSSRPVKLMSKRLLPVLICLLVATGAHAQGGGGHGRGGGRSPRGPAPASGAAPAAKATPRAPTQVEIVGVVQAIDRPADRVTIAYQAVEALNWPAGSMPFAVAKSSLLEGVTVGEKVRFSLDSSQISALRPD
jgi:Cu/Ag efflux protein CusF